MNHSQFVVQGASAMTSASGKPLLLRAAAPAVESGNYMGTQLIRARTT